MLRGIRGYFQENALPGTILASAKRGRHVIQSGDTLSQIAQQYQVSVNELRDANGLRGDRLQVGQVLNIPSQGG